MLSSLSSAIDVTLLRVAGAAPEIHKRATESAVHDIPHNGGVRRAYDESDLGVGLRIPGVSDKVVENSVTAGNGRGVFPVVMGIANTDRSQPGVDDHVVFDPVVGALHENSLILGRLDRVMAEDIVRGICQHE